MKMSIKLLKFLTIFLLLFTLLLSCSRRRVLTIDRALRNETVLIERSERYFRPIIDKVQQERRDKANSYEKIRRSYYLDDYDVYDYFLSATDKSLINIFARDKERAHSPSLSYDSSAVLYKVLEANRRGSTIIQEEQIYLGFREKNTYEIIYKSDKTERPDFLNHFPSIIWANYSYMYAFIGSERGSDNVFVGYFEDTPQGIVYQNFQITNNRDRSIFYFDLDFSSFGDRISFTEYNEQHKEYNVKIYDLERVQWKTHNLGKNTANFRFSNINTNEAFFSREINGVFYPHYIDNYRRRSSEMIEGAEGLVKPMFLANFAWEQDRLAFTSLKENNKMTLNIYSFFRRDNYFVKSEEFEYNTVVGGGAAILFQQNHGPKWFMNDNFILVNNITKNGWVRYARVIHDELKNVANPIIDFHRLVDERHLWEINSLSVSSSSNDFLIMCYDNSMESRGKQLYYYRPNLRSETKSLQDDLTLYRTEITFLGDEEGKSLFRLQRRRGRTRGEPIHGYVTSAKVFYFNQDEVDLNRLKDGGRFYIGWPSSIIDARNRDIEVRLEALSPEARIPRVNSQ